MKALDIIFGLICIPIGFILFLCVAVFATILWVPYLIWLIIKSIFFKDSDDAFLEFIFLCFGLSMLCMVMPYGIIEVYLK